MIDIFDLYNRMEANNIMLSFKGEITDDLMGNILQIMEARMNDKNEEPKLRKKVYNVLVECLQNLYHHIDKGKVNDSDSGSAIFMIGLGENGYTIMTGNYIREEKVAGFKEKLEKINSLNQDELKVYYKEMLNNEQMSDKGGAGLGMIDIARKTGEKLNFNFQDAGKGYSFFSLNIKVVSQPSTI